jgi:hypothetical protein
MSFNICRLRSAASMVAQSLRCSKWQAVPSASSGSAIADGYCWPPVNARGSFQCLIGEIIGHEGFVNFVEIAIIIRHCFPPIAFTEFVGAVANQDA